MMNNIIGYSNARTIPAGITGPHTMKICQVILAGGSGTRLWPLSRELFPKQLLPLSNEDSLLHNTATRLDGMPTLAAEDGEAVEFTDPVVVCNEEHRFLVAEHMRRAGKADPHILLEPQGRNTAPALTIAALAAQAGGDDPVLVVMPSDHIIENSDALHRATLRAIGLAALDYLVTFGISPDSPETGYGYIRLGDAVADAAGDGLPDAHAIDGFVEKPDAATAEQYLASGRYLWNSGMFVMKASVWLDAIGQQAPEIGRACTEAFGSVEKDDVFYRVDGEKFAACPSDSIDYAVMEKVAGGASGQRCAVVTLDAGWSDIGAWSALLKLRPGDEYGNVTEGDVLAIDTTNSLVMSGHRLIATLGITDTIVVETADAVMVAHKDHAQNVKQIVDALRLDQREEAQSHRRVYRPWGFYESVDDGDRFQVKRLCVSPGARLSLQSHNHRAEHWVVVSGTAKVVRGEEEFLLRENESTYIPIGMKHRLSNPGNIPVEIIEVQSGSYLGEDDIERFEDQYNRIKPST